MRIGSRRLLTAGVVLALLGGCVPDPTAGTAGLAAPATAQLIGGAYGASADAGIAIPAIPLDKVPVEFQRQSVRYPTAEAPGTIVIDPGQRLLYLVTGKNQALRYGIAVGKAGFEWSGVATIAERKTWPTWTPPREMIARKPDLAQWANGQPGGPTNPLGARALYLASDGIDYGYRIHGTPEWQSIGHNASSGCIRLINQDIIDLFARVPDGAKVVVLNRDGSYPTRLNVPPVQKPKPAAPATVTPVIAPGIPV